MNEQASAVAVAPAPREAGALAAMPRLMSLDVFRGATIAAMMLVNNPGNWSAIYPPLEHAPWHGWTCTDLVFPFFLWIVGVAIPLSTARRLEQGQRRGQLFLHVLRRSLIIFGLGLFLNVFSYCIDGSLFQNGVAAWLRTVLTNVRIPGVLQRIAVCYCLASLVFLVARIRGQVLAIIGLLVSYWLLMMLVPVPGHGAGVLEKEGNFSQYVDNLVLNGPTIGTHVYKGARTWDPEGIVSTLPAIGTCLFGILAGHLLRSRQTGEAKTAWLFVGGNLLLVAGSVMDAWLPINKNLWTSSYAVFMAGLAMNAFALCYWFIDVHGWKKWAKPFAIYGMNAITVFVLAGVLGRISLAVELTDAAGKKVALKTFLFDQCFAPFASPDTAPVLGWLASPKNASLMWALMYVGLLYLVAWFMYRRKWFVRF